MLNLVDEQRTHSCREAEFIETDAQVTAIGLGTAADQPSATAADQRSTFSDCYFEV